MKIGIVTTWFERGAAYVSKQYKSLLEINHEVLIYARGGEEYGRGDPEWDGPWVTWGKRVARPGETVVDLEDFKNWVTSNDLGVILFNEQHWWPAVACARSLNVKIATYVDYYTEATIPYFAMYDFLICNTKRHLTAFDWHPQAFYVPWGTNTDLFRPGKVDKRDHVVFFHSAGMSPVYRKGTDILLRAFEELKGEPATLLIHSQVPLKEKLSVIDNQILEDGLRDGRIEVIERTVPAPGLYHLGDVYVYPTKLEGLGLTIFEALSCGLPVIVPDQPPMNEFINAEIGKLTALERQYSRSDGYYWPCCHVRIDDLSNQMTFYIENYASMNHLSQMARNHALKYMNWNDRQEIVENTFRNSEKLEVDLAEFPSKSVERQRVARLPWLISVAKRVLYK